MSTNKAAANKAAHLMAKHHVYAVALAIIRGGESLIPPAEIAEYAKISKDLAQFRKLMGDEAPETAERGRQ